jgi:hypothetical protein
VVVLTHDNRLPETVRRLQIEATIWEVSRREGSEVEIRKNLDPVKRYLSDARALAKTDELADDVRGPLVLSFSAPRSRRPAMNGSAANASAGASGTPTSRNSSRAR